MKKIDVFIPELDLLHFEKLRQVTEILIEKISDEFFIAPASSTGKYHPLCANELGGLVIHTKRVFYLVNNLVDSHQLTPEQREILLISAIFHDSSKKRTYIKGEYDNHPVAAADFIKDNYLEAKSIYGSGLDYFWLQIQNCIIYHMGPWTPKSIRKSLDDYSVLERLIYVADYLASRRHIALPCDKFEVKTLAEELMRKGTKSVKKKNKKKQK